MGLAGEPSLPSPTVGETPPCCPTAGLEHVERLRDVAAGLCRFAGARRARAAPCGSCVRQQESRNARGRGARLCLLRGSSPTSEAVE